ncbi:MAG: ABC transporter permease [Spirochaetes bacterium]|nr:ABC transporter permease [Spirochaetota bacterium]
MKENGFTKASFSNRIREFQSFGPLMALLILIFVLSLTSKNFFSVNNIINIAQQTSINLIIALGMTTVIISGGIDLSVGSVLALSGCTMAQMSTLLGLNPVLAILSGIIVGVGIGAFNGFVISRTGIPDFIMTLGMLSAAKGLALIITRGFPITDLPPLLVFFGSARVFEIIPVSVLVAVIMSILMWFILNYTMLGRCAYAIGGNIEAARAAGMNVANYKVKFYALIGFCVSIASLVQVGRIFSANSLMGGGKELQAIAAVIIGGTNLYGGAGTIGGTIVGAFIMGVISNGLNLLNVSRFWQEFVMGSLIILVVVVNQIRKR